jgi:hypothetical protein
MTVFGSAAGTGICQSAMPVPALPVHPWRSL